MNLIQPALALGCLSNLCDCLSSLLCSCGPCGWGNAKICVPNGRISVSNNVQAEWKSTAIKKSKWASFWKGEAFLSAACVEPRWQVKNTPWNRPGDLWKQALQLKGVPWKAAANTRAPNLYPRSFLGDTSGRSQGRGRVQRWRLQVSGEYCTCP